MEKIIKTCPWCGATALMRKEPIRYLWHDNRGYVEEYYYELQCSRCAATAPYGRYDTIHAKPEEAERLAIDAWNARAEDRDYI